MRSNTRSVLTAAVPWKHGPTYKKRMRLIECAAFGGCQANLQGEPPMPYLLLKLRQGRHVGRHGPRSCKTLRRVVVPVQSRGCYVCRLRLREMTSSWRLS